MPQAGSRGEGEGADRTGRNPATAPAACPSPGPERGKASPSAGEWGTALGTRWRPPRGAAGGRDRGVPRVSAVPTSQAVSRLHAEDGDGAGACAILLPVAVLQDVPDLSQVLRLAGLRQLLLGRHVGRETLREVPSGLGRGPAALLSCSRQPLLLRTCQRTAFPAKQRKKGGQSGLSHSLPPALFPAGRDPHPPQGSEGWVACA